MPTIVVRDLVQVCAGPNRPASPQINSRIGFAVLHVSGTKFDNYPEGDELT
jgi:hypothetical protein